MVGGGIVWRGTHSDTLMMTSGWSSTASEPDELSEIGALTLGSSGAGSSMIIFCHGRHEEEADVHRSGGGRSCGASGT